MPYLEKEKIANIRKIIKNKYPNVKFSIKRIHYSTIQITIINHPDFKFNECFPNPDIYINQYPLIDEKTHKYIPINHFYIKDNYSHNIPLRDFLLDIYNIANESNYIVSVDGDYGNIPKFYVNMSFGNYENPYLNI